MRLVQVVCRVAVVVAVGLITAAGPAVAAADEPAPQSAPASVPEPIVLQPMHILDSEEEGEFYTLTINEPIAFSPDGRELFTYRSPARAVNVWAVLVYFWPEVLGTVTGLIGLVVLIVLVRALRRPRQRGLPYCRRCNYCLEKCASERCPECGVRLARRRSVRGRRFVWRLAPALSVLLLVGGFYATLWIAGVDRDNDAQYWFEWWSDALGPVAERHTVALEYCDWRGDRLMAIDTQTGEERVVRTAREMDDRPWPVMAPDGRSLFVHNGNGGIQQIDTRSGALSGPPWQTCGYLPWCDLLGVSPDGERLYAKIFAGSPSKDVLFEWDPTAQAGGEIPAVPGWSGERMGHVRLVPGHDELRLLIVNDWYAGEIVLWEPYSADHAVVSFEIGSRAFSEISPDGDALYVLAEDRLGMQVYDLASGTHVKTIDIYPGTYAVEAAGPYLLVASRTPKSAEVTVRVLSAPDDGHVLAALAIPAGLYADTDRHLLAPDGSYACVRCYVVDEEMRFPEKLLLYDLSSLDDSSH